MVVVKFGHVGGLHFDQGGGVCHRIAKRRHCQHPEVVFVVPKGGNFVGGNLITGQELGDRIGFGGAGLAD